MTEYKIDVSGEDAKIFTPYNAKFVEKVKLIGGAKWDSASRCWRVPANAVSSVREIMRSVYGRDDLEEGETVKVRLSFGKRVEKYRESVTIMGKTVSRAFGRDSGARPGDDAVYLDGKPDSGGSVKNWTSLVEEGSIVILSNVPKSIFDAEKGSLPDGVTCEIVIDDESNKNRAALMREKERLLARLAEIEKILNEV